MGIIESRNKEEARHEENGVVYYDRGVLTGRDGRKYLRYAIQTHFIEVGEDKCALIERYVRPLYREGDMLSFGAKVMAMCEKTVRTRDEVKPGFWANLLWRFAGINHTGVGMHEPQAAIGHRYLRTAPRAAGGVLQRGYKALWHPRRVLQGVRQGRGWHRRLLLPLQLRSL